MQTGKESFRRAMLLIAFGVILFAAVTHLQDLWMGFMGLMGLFSPILLAGAFALILNVPVRGFERIFARLDRRNHLKPGTRNMLGLTLTLLLLPLVLAVVGRFILPQFFSAINAVVTLIRDNTDQIERFAMELGLDPKIVSQKLSEVSQWISQNLGNLAGTAVTTIASVFSSVASIVMSLILAIYLLGNKARVKRQCAALLTAFGWFDNIARFAGAGTLVPITGFANAMVSPAMEFKSEGIITGLGVKTFTIAGPVLVFGISASVIYGLVLWVMRMLLPL